MKKLIFALLVIFSGCTSHDARTKRITELDSLLIESRKASIQSKISAYQSGWSDGYLEALEWTLYLRTGKIDQTPTDELRKKSVQKFMEKMGYK